MSGRPKGSNALALSGLAALGAALSVWLFMAQDPVTQAILAKPDAPKSALGAAPFGNAVVAVPMDTRQSIAPAIELMGIGQTRNGRAFASIKINGASARQYVVGDVLSVGVRLTGIGPGSVELQRGRVTELLAGPVSKAEPFSAPANGRTGAAQEPVAPSTPLSRIEPNIITQPVDQPPPSSSRVERAIGRATRP